jgi:hypothetical protein
MKKIVLSLAVSLSLTIGSAQTTKKVCFLGNSYTYVNDLPSLIDSIAHHDGGDLIKDQNTPGGHTLNGHSVNAVSLAKISSNTWDYVVLQDQSQFPSFPFSQTSVDVFPKAIILSDSIRSANICAIPLFFNTWGREIGDAQWDSINTFEKMNNRLFIAYDKMANTNNGKLSPVGIGFRHVFDDASTIVTHGDLYSADGSHPSIYGSYLAACIFYNVIFETTPIGNTFLPSGVTQNQADYLQFVANHVVNDVDTVTVNYSDDPTASFSYVNTNFDVEFTTVNQIGYTYSWDFGDGANSIDSNPIHTYGAGGNYEVTLTVVNTNTPCNLESQITIEIIIGELGLNTNQNSEFKIFPNPTNGTVNMETADFENRIYIYNLQGQIQKELKPVSALLTFDLPRGLYLIKQGDLVQKVKVD